MWFVNIFNEYNVKEIFLISAIFIIVFTFFIWLKIRLLFSISKFKKESENEIIFISMFLTLLLSEVLFLVMRPFWLSSLTTDLSFVAINVFGGVIYLLILSSSEFIFTKKFLLENTNNIKVFS